MAGSPSGRVGRTRAGRPGRTRTETAAATGPGFGSSVRHRPGSTPCRPVRPRGIRTDTDQSAPGEDEVDLVGAFEPVPNGFGAGRHGRVGEADSGDAHVDPVDKEPNLGQVRRHERRCVFRVVDEHGPSVDPHAQRILERSLDRGFKDSTRILQSAATALCRNTNGFRDKGTTDAHHSHAARVSAQPIADDRQADQHRRAAQAVVPASGQLSGGRHRRRRDARPGHRQLRSPRRGQVRALRMQGADVVGLDSRPSPWTDVVGFVNDPHPVREAMAGVEVVFHMAALHKPNWRSSPPHRSWTLTSTGRSRCWKPPWQPTSARS